MVFDAIISRIRDDGPIGFDEYMTMCLYDPESGFYGAGRVRPGTAGADFTTAPEVSPWFGRLLGRWASTVSEDDAVLVEVAAGSGALLGPLLEASGGRFHRVYAIEVSPTARDEIAGRLPGVEVLDDLDGVPGGGCAVVLANELLDNLPFRIVERRAGEWIEHRVGEEDGALVMVRHRDEELSEWCDRMIDAVPDGSVMAAQVDAARWVTDVIERFDAVALCVVDYAANSVELAGRAPSGVVRAYRGHRTGLDVLATPGKTDVTTDVNVDTVVRAARQAGATVAVTDQRSFLRGLGAGEVLDEMADRERGCAAAGDVMGQLTARSEAVNLRALLDPGGFGGFTVFEITAGT